MSVAPSQSAPPTSTPGTAPLGRSPSTELAATRTKALNSTPELTRDDRRAMRRSGLPSRPRLRDRIRTSPVTYLTPLLLIGYLLCLVWEYRTMVPDRQLENGSTIPGLGVEAIFKANDYAVLTVVPLALLFVLLDRYRTQTFLPRLGIWLLTFGWGACVATAFSLWLNTWMGQHLGIMGKGDPATGARAAVFVAPFVEEFAKATVLFWIAILARYRWVSRLGAISLAGLSAAAFAYVENIIYYGRAFRYAAQTYGQVTPEEALQQIFLIRGVFSFFAHPLFTIMTAIGLTIGLRSRSKTVRVLAPLAGFLGAALLHMAWNGLSSTLPNPMPLYWFLAIPLLMAVIGFAIRGVTRESRLVRARLGDYVLTGWLADEDRQVIASPTRRLGLVWWAMYEHPLTAFTGPFALVVGPLLLLGVWLFDWHPAVEFLVIAATLVAIVLSLVVPTPWRATLRWLRAGTELAYLRDSITRGLVDEAGQAREGELFGELEDLRDAGVRPSAGPVRYPWTWIAESVSARRARAAGRGPRPTAGTQHSAVDPSWAPPGG